MVYFFTKIVWFWRLRDEISLTSTLLTAFIVALHTQDALNKFTQTPIGDIMAVVPTDYHIYSYKVMRKIAK